MASGGRRVPGSGGPRLKSHLNGRTTGDPTTRGYRDDSVTQCMHKAIGTYVWALVVSGVLI